MATVICNMTDCVHRSKRPPAEVAVQERRKVLWLYSGNHWREQNF